MHNEDDDDDSDDENALAKAMSGDLGLGGHVGVDELKKQMGGLTPEMAQMMGLDGTVFRVPRDNAETNAEARE